jgi:CelD/BcsL family acetyltransferase involved in cellulose biosynthesis
VIQISKLTAVSEIDPVRDPRWPAFLERHPRASVFHTAGWLEALRRTYGYEPFAVTTAAPGEDLSNGLVFCRVKSWVTGRRMVSLPFSDHCEPLVQTEEEFERLLSAVKDDLREGRSKYLEIRPLTLPGKVPADLVKTSSVWLHRLDLRPDLKELFRGLHKNCIQRKIARAHREALSYEEGRTEALLSRFYRLLVLTRRRQQLVPQPLAWFRNLVACLGDRLKIRVTSKDGRPLASILTLRYKDTLVYKYGCSDTRFNNLGGMQLLFWKAIQEAKEEQLTQFDLGRSDWDHSGLIAFKDRWGADRTPVHYWRFGAVPVRDVARGRPAQIARFVFGHVPAAVLPLAGRLMYRHLP